MLSLAGQVLISGLVGGACFNPAVALGQTIFAAITLDSNAPQQASIHHYCYIYFIFPMVGGALAGLWQIVHD